MTNRERFECCDCGEGWFMLDSARHLASELGPLRCQTRAGLDHVRLVPATPAL